MLNDRPSRIALVISLLLHAVLLAPVWERLGLLPGEAAPVAVEREEPLEFRFVDPQPPSEEPPDEPTPNVSTADARAAQPEAPETLPEGDAFSPGRAPVQTTPRPSGQPSAEASPGAAPSSGTPDPTEPSETERREAESAEPTEEGRLASGDRLAIPRNPVGFDAPPAPRRAPPGAGAELPEPRLDARLTRAAAGSEFSLNTTEWDWAPYIQRLKEAIERNIHPPEAFYYGAAAWATRVRFRIGPNGQLLALQRLDHRGVPNLEYVSTDAIRATADFEPLPPDFPAPYLEITGSFYFNTFPRE